MRAPKQLLFLVDSRSLRALSSLCIPLEPIAWILDLHYSAVG